MAWTSPAVLAASFLSAALLLAGCRSPTARTTVVESSGALPTLASEQSSAQPLAMREQLASYSQPASLSPPVELVDPPAIESRPPTLTLGEVVSSVVTSYPLLTVAFQSRQVAAGEQLAAAGAFDLKLKAESNNTPLGFYETYRHMAGLEQPLYRGGNLFAGYRVGRGNFEPWYLERQTNEGGEFKAGGLFPLLQNRQIDPRRADLWRSQWARRTVEPSIQAEVLLYVYEASTFYWQWVAAGLTLRVAQEQVDLAQDRQQAIDKQVQAGNIARIESVDNRRLIVSREAKLIEARQKLEQAALKLSLYLRDGQGQPVVVAASQLPASFPVAAPNGDAAADEAIQLAIDNRPELAYLNFVRRQLEVDLAEARNLALPEVDAYVTASQDVGEPTSPKRDKSKLELETGLVGSVPLQRRKAAGKLAATQAKLAQLTVKRQFATDKIANEVANARVALDAAYERIETARQARDLALQMADAERKKLAAGDSDLLLVNLREQQAADAVLGEVQAQLDYFQAEAAYRAAMGFEPTSTATTDDRQ